MTDAISDPILGKLEPLDDFTHARQLQLDGRSISLSIETGEGLTDAAVTQARRLLASLADIAGRAATYAGGALVDLKNDTWLADQPLLTAPAIAARLELEACEVAADGVATLYFSDGEQFGGHSVIVYLAADGEFMDAKLAG